MELESVARAREKLWDVMNNISAMDQWGSAEDVVRLAAKLHVPRLPKTVVEAWDRVSDSHYRDGGENNS
jgi:hypothetical protein